MAVPVLEDEPVLLLEEVEEPDPLPLEDDEDAIL